MRLLDLIPITWVDWYIKFKSKNFEKFKSLVFHSSPELLEDISKRKTLFIFKKTVKNVKYYKEYLESKGINYEQIKNIEDFIKFVPSIDKDNYVKKAKHIHDLCFPYYAKRPELLVRSSGFSGKPQIWVESEEEIENSKRYVSLGLDMLYQTKKFSTLIINGFALGSWVGGINLLKELEDEGSIVNPGLVEDEILDLVNQFKDEYEQILIAGNPVFLKNLIDEGIKKKLNLKKYKIHIFTAGESITEGWRNYLYSKLNSPNNKDKEGKIYSIFGASDIGVVGINETETSVIIRKIALKNQKLRNALFDDDGVLPMLFQYDPTKFFISENKNKELEFTTCSFDIATPLIKYNLHDLGGVITYNKMNEILSKFNIRQDIKFPFPFIYIKGRSDGTISLCSSNIYPSNIQQTIYEDKKLSSYSSGRFRLIKKYDKNHNACIHIDIQLEKGKSPTKKLNKLFANAIYNLSFKKNPNLKNDLVHLEKKHKKIIEVKLYKYQDYISNSKIKVKYLA